MTYTRTLADPDVRRRVLDDIVRLASPTPGTTVIAHVDIATHDVVAWKAIPTRTPVMRVGRHATSHATETMWDFYQQLCGIAQEIVPARTWDGKKNGPITGLTAFVAYDGRLVAAAQGLALAVASPGAEATPASRGNLPG